MHSDQRITFSYPEDFLKKAASVATYYGFTPLNRALEEAKKERKAAVQCSLDASERHIDALSGQITSTVKSCVQWSIGGKEKGPALVFQTHVSEQKKGPKNMSFGVHVVGTPKSVAEAMVLRTTLAICEELGIKNVGLRVNSIGDRDSVARFSRELVNFFRKNSGDLPANIKEVSTKEPVEALTMLLEKQHPLFEGAPRSVDFLSEASRRHLREVIEFIENIGVPYEIDDRVMGNKNCYSQTIFELKGSHKLADGHVVVAKGGRYDEFSKKYFKAAMPGAGLVLHAHSHHGKGVELALPTHRPKIFFVQLGFEARLKSLSIVESLRHARIPVRQSLSTESLSEQLTLAENMKIPYALIMGYKEVLENAVIVRKMETRAQDSVPVGGLTDYLRKVLK